MRIVLIISGVLLAASAIFIEASHRVSAATASVSVTSSPSNSFVDATSGNSTSTINVGDTVEWSWASGFHDVQADDSSFDSGAPTSPPKMFSLTFNSAGTFGYHCTVHGGPGGAGMSGTITVQAAPTATATNTVAAATATATRTPAATVTGTPPATATPTTTPSGTVTAPLATATPIVAAPIIAAQPDGGAAPSLGAPTVGDGSASQGGGSSHTASIVLAAMGAALIAGAAAVRRRA